MEATDIREAPKCPQCRLHLRSLRHAGVEVDFCVECRGLWFDRRELERIVGVGSPFSLRENLSVAVSKVTRRRCPLGHGYMREQETDPGSGILIDWCPQCFGVWLDRGELTQMRALRPRTDAIPEERVGGLESRIEEAQRQWDEARITVEESKVTSGPRHWFFQWLFGLPVEVYNPVRNRPIATYGLIAVNMLFFLAQVLSPHLLIDRLALLPSAFLHGVAPWTLLTAMFMHGNPLHILGNMYFLRVFGDNVEDRVGFGQYLVLYLLGGVVASLAHIASDPTSTTPVIGASGAVSAILGAYLYLFPERRLYMMIFFRLLRVRAIWYLGVYLALQFVFAALGVPGVAWWAHIGGFAVGLAWAAAYRARLRHHIASLETTFGGQ